MRCTEARDGMHELLSGTLTERASLDAHLASCTECAEHFHALTEVSAAADRLAGAPVDSAALDRIAEGLRSKLDAPARPLLARPLPRLALAGLAAAALFTTGLAAGRSTRGTQTLAAQVVEKPVYIERTVEVPKPVVEERVVVREVPIVHTRVVYRDRPAKALEATSSPAQYAVANAIPPEPVNEPIAVGVIVSQSFRPARVAPEPSAEPGTPPA
jgi:hypothetical protein